VKTESDFWGRRNPHAGRPRMRRFGPFPIRPYLGQTGVQRLASLYGARRVVINAARRRPDFLRLDLETPIFAGDRRSTRASVAAKSGGKGATLRPSGC